TCRPFSRTARGECLRVPEPGRRWEVQNGDGTRSNTIGQHTCCPHAPGPAIRAFPTPLPELIPAPCSPIRAEEWECRSAGTWKFDSGQPSWDLEFREWSR